MALFLPCSLIFTACGNGEHLRLTLDEAEKKIIQSINNSNFTAYTSSYKNSSNEGTSSYYKNSGDTSTSYAVSKDKENVNYVTDLSFLAYKQGDKFYNAVMNINYDDTLNLYNVWNYTLEDYNNEYISSVASGYKLVKNLSAFLFIEGVTNINDTTGIATATKYIAMEKTDGYSVWYEKTNTKLDNDYLLPYFENIIRAQYVANNHSGLFVKFNFSETDEMVVYQQSSTNLFPAWVSCEKDAEITNSNLINVCKIAHKSNLTRQVDHYTGYFKMKYKKVIDVKDYQSLKTSLKDVIFVHEDSNDLYLDKQLTQQLTFETIANLTSNVVVAHIVESYYENEDNYYKVKEHVVYPNDMSEVPQINDVNLVIRAEKLKIDKTYYNLFINNSFKVAENLKQNSLIKNNTIFVDVYPYKLAVEQLYGSRAFEQTIDLDETDKNNFVIENRFTGIANSLTLDDVILYEKTTEEISMKNILVYHTFIWTVEENNLVSLEYFVEPYEQHLPRYNRYFDSLYSCEYSFNYGYTSSFTPNKTAQETLTQEEVTIKLANLYSDAMVEDIVLKNGEALNLADMPALSELNLPEDVEFDGWYEDKNCTIPAFANQEHKVAKYKADSNNTYYLYPKYINLPTLTINANGGTVIGNVTNDVSLSMALSGIRVYKKGYNFAGWYNDIELTSPVTSANYLTFNKNVYAKWEPIRKLTFVTQSDHHLGFEVLSLDGGTVTLPKAVERPGYILVGWKLGSSTQDDNIYTSEFDYSAGEEDITLYAQYEEGYQLDIYSTNWEYYNNSTTPTVEYRFNQCITVPKTQPDGYTFEEFYSEYLFENFGVDVSEDLDSCGYYYDQLATRPLVGWPTGNYYLYWIVKPKDTKNPENNLGKMVLDFGINGEEHTVEDLSLYFGDDANIVITEQNHVQLKLDYHKFYYLLANGYVDEEYNELIDLLKDNIKVSSNNKTLQIKGLFTGYNTEGIVPVFENAINAENMSYENGTSKIFKENGLPNTNDLLIYVQTEIVDYVN